jgi:hypothetical protein
VRHRPKVPSACPFVPVMPDDRSCRCGSVRWSSASALRRPRA